MVTPASLLFSPKQVRELLDLPDQQLRNWRKLLPAIGRERSGQAVFDFADLLALAVVRRLVVDGGVRVGLLEPVAQQLVELCKSVTLDEAAELRAEFQAEENRIAFKHVDAPAPPLLLVMAPLEPILKALLGRLTLPPDGSHGLPLFRQ